jgi:hypothetical protein
VLWQRPAVLSRTLEALSRRASSGPWAARIGKVRALERDIYTFASRRRAALAPLVGTELAFHALGVLEVHVTLWLLLGTPPPLLTSFILETVNRLINVVFKIVPLQVGVNEAGSALTTQILGLGTMPGLTLGIVRKARMLFWTIVGALLLVRHGLTARRALADAELARRDLHQTRTPAVPTPTDSGR